MFGHRFFGARYYGPRYFGGVGADPPPPTPTGLLANVLFLSNIGRMMNKG